MGAIEDIYADLDADIDEAAFREAVTEKVEQMGGLADEETAAMLVAHELADDEVSGIADIEPGMDEVQFVGKVVAVGERRTFERDDGEEGQVVNIEVADETGRIRVALWDDMAESAATELETGTVLRIKGHPSDGWDGVEVSAGRVEVDEETDIEVRIQDDYRVEDLALGQSDVDLRGQVLGTEPVRTFDRDDGSEGRVSNLVVGDETGRIRVTLWDEKADLVDEFTPGESVEVIDGYVRERDDSLELHVGNRGSVGSIDEDVTYVPDATDIADLDIGETVDLAGVVRSADPKRTFDRDDGSQGQVRNIRVQDETGDVRVALWGEKADIEVGPGDEVQLGDVEIRDGWQDDLEASAGWRSTVTVLEDAGVVPDESVDGPAAESDDEPGLSAFANAGDDADEEQTESDAARAGTAGTEPSDDDERFPDGESIEFTGVVVQAGDPVVLDDGTETLAVETDADVTLGEELTVRGTVRGGRIEPEELL